jgi:hypothetical protein
MRNETSLGKKKTKTKKTKNKKTKQKEAVILSLGLQNYIQHPQKGFRGDK